MKILVVLQCAYRSSGRQVPYQVWLRGLWLSHTGKRLSRMLPDGPEYHIINASPKVGISSSVAFPPDLDHLAGEIAAAKPDAILACGRVAQAGLNRLGQSYVAAPHPAWRQLSEAMVANVYQQLCALCPQRSLEP